MCYFCLCFRFYQLFVLIFIFSSNNSAGNPNKSYTIFKTIIEKKNNLWRIKSINKPALTNTYVRLYSYFYSPNYSFFLYTKTSQHEHEYEYVAVKWKKKKKRIRLQFFSFQYDALTINAKIQLSFHNQQRDILLK